MKKLSVKNLFEGLPVKLKTVEYDCPIHGKQVYEILQTSKGGFCPQCVIERKKKETLLSVAHAESARQVREIQNLFHPVAISDIENFTFENAVINDEKERKVFEIVRRFAERFSERETPRLEAFDCGAKDRYQINTTGLFFFGKSGTGKTYLACSIINELKKQGFETAFMTASELVNGYTSIAFSERNRALSLLTNVPVLIIDELGRQRNANIDQSFLWTVINDRIRYGRPTVFITNFEGEELKTMLDDSVRDRLKSSTFQLAFNWESKRRRINAERNPMEIF